MCKEALRKIIVKLEKDKILREVINELESKGYHTIILYGSRAKGKETKLSDYDLIAIGKNGKNLHENRLICGFYIDLFIYNEADVKNIDSSFLRVRGGIVLKEKDNLGQHILEKVEEIFISKPQAPTEAQIEFQRSWARKMIERVDSKENEITEINYRRVEILYLLLEQYFVLRRKWYLGPKESFSWLKKHDLNTYKCFDKALSSSASVSDIIQLVNRVLYNLNHEENA
ncbi:MAG: nucleotidyltransferase domain-containing protein [Leptolyngbyaceae bacterium]|nr:nucleotidyltransferase domain-containing protein [Leptolyngbyaceae bacterium]